MEETDRGTGPIHGTTGAELAARAAIAEAERQAARRDAFADAHPVPPSISLEDAPRGQRNPLDDYIVARLLELSANAEDDVALKATAELASYRGLTARASARALRQAGLGGPPQQNTLIASDSVLKMLLTGLQTLGFTAAAVGASAPLQGAPAPAEGDPSPTDQSPVPVQVLSPQEVS